MRVIIRFSLNKDKNGALTNALRTVLGDHGIKLTDGTSTYEGDVPESTIEEALSSFWHEVTNRPEVKVDHFWMYADRHPPTAKSREDVDPPTP